MALKMPDVAVCLVKGERKNELCDVHDEEVMCWITKLTS